MSAGKLRPKFKFHTTFTICFVSKRWILINRLINCQQFACGVGKDQTSWIMGVFFEANKQKRPCALSEAPRETIFNPPNGNIRRLQQPAPSGLPFLFVRPPPNERWLCHKSGVHRNKGLFRDCSDIHEEEKMPLGFKGVPGHDKWLK